MRNRKDRIVDFLLKNNYSKNGDLGDEYMSFEKMGVSSIHISSNEIVFVDETGDWLYIPLNYYALIGALIEFRQIAINYISVNKKKMFLLMKMVNIIAVKTKKMGGVHIVKHVVNHYVYKKYLL